MQRNRKLRIYLDTCVYIAFFEKDEKLDKKYVDIISATIDKKEIMLVISDILEEEIIKHKFTDTQYQKISDIINRTYIYKVEEDIVFKIYKEALIETSRQSHKDKKTRILKDKDARHLQSAITANVDELHTLDNDILRTDHETMTRNNNVRVISPNDSKLLEDYLI